MEIKKNCIMATHTFLSLLRAFVAGCNANIVLVLWQLPRRIEDSKKIKFLSHFLSSTTEWCRLNSIQISLILLHPSSQMVFYFIFVILLLLLSKCDRMSFSLFYREDEFFFSLKDIFSSPNLKQ